MKFQLIGLGLFNFLHIRFCELQKHRNKYLRKNATRYRAGPAYYRMCSTDCYCSVQSAAVAPKETIHQSFLRFSELGRRKTVDAAKICGGAEMLLNELSKHCKWIA